MNKLFCTGWGQEYHLSEPVWKCRCGGLLDISFTCDFPIGKISLRKQGLWRYREAIPVNLDHNIVTFDEGYTPLLDLTIAGKKIKVKLDYLFPSGSYKDRGASILISKIKELGITKVVEDSSGNAGASIATYCARAGIKARIFVPETASGVKIMQIESTGAEVIKIKGDRQKTAEAALKEVGKTYYASHCYNPFFLQGTKTFAYEICEQLGWKCPDAVVLPVGNGTILLGTYLGFTDLKTAGIIENLPRLIGVQAQNCNPLYRMFTDKLDNLPILEFNHTIAEGIGVSEPPRYRQILEAVEQTGGYFISVNEEEILESFTGISRHGYFIEPTTAVVLAAINKVVESLKELETIVTVFTGSGMKTNPRIFSQQ
jgi:threonine synthase